MSKLELLRSAIADDALPMSERKQAAEHLVETIVDAVPEPADDDEEVLELMKPWKDDGPVGSIATMAWRARNEVYGWNPSGPTLAQAKKSVHDRLKMRALLAVVVDEQAHRLERLGGCQGILDQLPPRNFYRVNNYNAEQLLAKVKPTSATKYEMGMVSRMDHRLATEIVTPLFEKL